MLRDVMIVAAEDTGGGGAELLIPPAAELWAGIIAFAIVFFFIWRWALPAINKTLEDRQHAIAGQLEEAEKAKVEAQSLLDDYKKQLATAKSEANQIIEEARQSAESVKADIVAKAQAEADEIVGKARSDAENEKARALAEAKEEVANISLDLAEKVVGNTIDRNAQKSLVDQYLAQLERM